MHILPPMPSPSHASTHAPPAGFLPPADTAAYAAPPPADACPVGAPGQHGMPVALRQVTGTAAACTACTRCTATGCSPSQSPRAAGHACGCAPAHRDSCRRGFTAAMSLALPSRRLASSHSSTCGLAHSTFAGNPCADAAIVRQQPSQPFQLLHLHGQLVHGAE